jgi:hypothetical protein
MMAAIAGWYPDPEIPGQLRWWDGNQWTDHRSAMPVAAVQPAPQPTAAAWYGAAAYPPPRPERPRKSRGWLWLVGAVAIVALVLGTVFATGHLTFTSAKSTKPSSSPTPEGSADLAPQLPRIAAFGNPQAPAGMTEPGGATAPVIGETTNAGQALESYAGLSKIPLSIPACSALMFNAPVTASDVGSVDPVLLFPDYHSVDGASTLAVQGGVRQYTSPAAAAKSFGAMEKLHQKCSDGYSNPFGHVSVNKVSGEWPGSVSDGWDQVVPDTGLIEKMQAVNLLSGSLIVRVVCDSTGDSNVLDGECTDWTSALQHSLVTAAS